MNVNYNKITCAHKKISYKKIHRRITSSVQGQINITHFRYNLFN